MIFEDENGFVDAGDADLSEIVHFLNLDVLDSFDEIPQNRYIEEFELELVQELKRRKANFYRRLIRGE